MKNDLNDLKRVTKELMVLINSKLMKKTINHFIENSDNIIQKNKEEDLLLTLQEQEKIFN